MKITHITDEIDFNERKVTQIKERFNQDGIFPSDSEMIEAVHRSDEFEDELELELYLLDIASNDETHPYHHMTIPRPIDGFDYDEIFG